MTTAFTIPGTTRYHLDANCPALDSARLTHSGVFRTTDTADFTPCLVCASTAATEWTLTSENLGELLELVGPSKPHWAPLPAEALGVSTQIDGLTIWAHNGQPRTVARYGDTITRQPGGTWTVTRVEARA
ncbi:hypothetical protein [Kitasatospora cathayae]|uniref:Uncharacterized protein n=1 Tax=Kitasatospora cathayae TaxID=3004092 RepID=A0ABY7Q9S7_9ACTN|nr:hypothetical protein [Kitasatospora sp. HUAS 3-15]WBP89490.1 hypothetical protein O1G21_29065 [Kitasatospora sp. HUAS 3-15]